MAVASRLGERRRRCLCMRAVFAAVAQLVERVLGKDEVTGSIPVSSFSVLHQPYQASSTH